ncbi:long-chain fatty acid--CoA ligase [Sporosarcina sp. BI001-red]|uniref:class I adenylate-forming enzyme family protein n=1 Tax=Sporosarcina sp. BI001-red TaxID=2282866 RepID=UPI000E23BC11|nr:class I adenylate-forming enzyme family protein [Sporosarcina sp. BI001-red]REB08764.1 long-chain fatty acid--CoA ligase [Sporosarcina sp. BI001-red]
MPQYFTELLERNATSYPEKTAYQFMGTSVTWKHYYDEVQRMTNSFLTMGLKPGDKVATILPQTPAFMTIYLAAGQMGLVVVPLDPRFKATEMINLCNRTEPKMLVCFAGNETLKETTKQLLKEIEIPHVFSYMGKLDVPGAKLYEVLLDSPVELTMPFPPPTLDDPLIIIFTSGSTGLPKGGVLTHRNTFAIAKATVETWGITSDDKMLLNMPTSHVGGTHDMIAVQLYAGASGVISPTFVPAEIPKLIHEYKVTIIGGVPSMYRLIFQHATLTDYDLHSLKLLIVSGEPSSPELIHRIQTSFPNASVVASWGMTETSGFFTFTNVGDPVERITKTEGKPGPEFEMAIMQADGTTATPHGVGEIWVKGDSVIKSYLDTKDNASSFSNGWLKTGDIGYLDEKNYLHFIGRSKEMYISGGYNVYPMEIETVLNAHPAVNASCIIEVEDETWGEVGIAFIVPENEGTLDQDEIVRYCRQELADYKCPKKVIIQSDLPKTLIGKIDKQKIRKSLHQFVEVAGESLHTNKTLAAGE